jgi:hypothetical protein
MAGNRFKTPACPNCGARYVEAPKHSFCSGCGQENRDLDVPVRHLLAQAVESLLHFDTKTVRTLKALAVRPGLLTTEFLQGRRARYVGPVRLYVFVSFVFFLVLALPTGGHEADSARAAAADRGGFYLSYWTITSADLRGVRDSEIDALMRSRGIAATPFNRYLLRQMAHISRGGSAEVRHVVVKSASYMMFALMPVFGLLLFAFFRKSAPHYVASLVFSLHYHSFAFLLLTVLTPVSWLPRMGPSVLLSPLVLAFYLLFALRSVYRRSWRRTLLLTVAIGSLHAVCVLLLLNVTALSNILLF